MSVTKRFIFLFFCILGVYFLPWWFLFFVMVSVMIFFRKVLFELILPAILTDAIYSIKSERFFEFQFFATFVMAIILLIAWFIKRYFRV